MWHDWQGGCERGPGSGCSCLSRPQPELGVGGRGAGQPWGMGPKAAAGVSQVPMEGCGASFANLALVIKVTKLQPFIEHLLHTGHSGQALSLIDGTKNLQHKFRRCLGSPPTMKDTGPRERLQLSYAAKRQNQDSAPSLFNLNTRSVS